MKALILAAGQGDRLEHLTEDLPKALVKVAGEELVRYQLSFLNQKGVEAVGCVVGYQATPLKHFLKKAAPHVAIFENPNFTQGSILSLKAAIPFLDDDLLLMNVDHIYPQRLFSLLSQQPQAITAVCDFDRKLAADDMKIQKNESGFLHNIHKELKEYDGGYIGMTLCAKSRLDSYKKGIEKVLASAGPMASVEMVLRELAKSNETIHIADTSGIRWLEVDTLGDLRNAEEALKKNPLFLA